MDVVNTEQQSTSILSHRLKFYLTNLIIIHQYLTATPLLKKITFFNVNAVKFGFLNSRLKSGFIFLIYSNVGTPNI